MHTYFISIRCVPFPFCGLQSSSVKLWSINYSSYFCERTFVFYIALFSGFLTGYSAVPKVKINEAVHELCVDSLGNVN